MFSHLILGLRSAGLPTSITEYLTLMAAMKSGIANTASRIFTICRAPLW